MCDLQEFIKKYSEVCELILNNLLVFQVQCLALTILLTYQNQSEDEEQFDLVDPHKQYTHSLTLNRKYNPHYELGN